MNHYFNNYILKCSKNIDTFLKNKFLEIKKSKSKILDIFNKLEERWVELFTPNTKKRILGCGDLLIPSRLNWRFILRWNFCNNRFCPYCSISKWIKEWLKLEEKYKKINNNDEHYKTFITLTTINQGLSLDQQILLKKEYIKKISQRIRKWKIGKLKSWFGKVDWLFYRIEIVKNHLNQWNVHLHWLIVSKNKIEKSELANQRYKISWASSVDISSIKSNVLPVCFYINKSNFINIIDDFVEYYNSTFWKRLSGYMGDFRWIC